MKRTLPCLLSLLMLTVGTPAWSESNNSNSNSSGDSSRTSDQSEQSSKSNSSGNSNSNTTDDDISTMIFVTTVIVTAGASAFGVVWSSLEISENQQRKAAEKLAVFLKQNHGSVTRDVLLAQGVFWEQWQIEMGLTSNELRAFQSYFSGSKQQQSMLQTLNSEVSTTHARDFAKQLLSAAKSALGKERFERSCHFALSQAKLHMQQAG